MVERKKLRILIVDDNLNNLQLLGKILTDNGYEVIVATSGAQALKNIEKKDPDLILLDIMMPDMDGFEVCKRLKANDITKHIPVIFITAKKETDDIVKGFEVGAIDYITKPFNTMELLVRVKTHIEMKILKGLMPICANCKKIRNDQGAWDEIEAFFNAHTDMMLSHSICPDCMKKIYGNEDWFKDYKKENE